LWVDLAIENKLNTLMISDITTAINMLRHEATAIGITESEARKYGDIRHRRTWSLAIEHHLSMQGESEPKTETQTATLSLPQPPVQRTGRSYNKVSQRIRKAKGFEQVVQNHIKALKTASSVRTNQSNLSMDNWVCPECGPQGETSCNLCAGTGNVDDIAAIGWTLAYMEMLGCSARELEPLRRFYPASNILELNLKVCVAIKESSEVLARTEKLVISH
jgi:rubrerythrin